MYDFYRFYFTIILRSRLAGHKVCIVRVPGYDVVSLRPCKSFLVRTEYTIQRKV